MVIERGEVVEVVGDGRVEILGMERVVVKR